MTVTNVDKDFDSLTITLIADFDAPIEQVWQLWADPRKLERWWGPPAYPATFEKHDLTPGGEVTYFMTGSDGDRYRRHVAGHGGRSADVAAVHGPVRRRRRDADRGHAGQHGQGRAHRRGGGTRMEM